MSNSTPEQIAINPEAERAFDELTSLLEQEVREAGTPIEVSGAIPINGALRNHDEAYSKRTGIDFTPNASKLMGKVSDIDGREHPARVVLLSDEIRGDTDQVGLIEVSSPESSHPADIFIMQTDKSIEHFRRTGGSDGFSKDHESPNWHERVEPKGVLNAAQIKDLIKVLTWEEPLKVEPEQKHSIGAVAMSADVAYDDYLEEAYPEEDEDPLEGDVDRFVHPDETMTDEERDRAERFAVEPYDEDASESYWAEYDALHADDNETPDDDKN